MSQLLDDVAAFIDTLGELDAYQRAQASLAIELASSLGTAIAAAPVAKELRDLLSALQTQCGNRDKALNPLEALQAQAR